MFAFAPIAEHRRRRLKVAIPHLLRHPRDGIHARIPEHAQQHVDAAEIGFDAIIRGVRTALRAGSAPTENSPSWLCSRPAIARRGSRIATSPAAAISSMSEMVRGVA
eukprot:5206730-Prymnesium_polylepis.3